MLFRPFRVIQIAQWLIHTGELYKQENIKINTQWLEDFENSHIHESIGTENISESNDSDLHLEGNNLNKDNSRKNWVEVDDSQLIAGVIDTMLSFQISWIIQNVKGCLMLPQERVINL